MPAPPPRANDQGGTPVGQTHQEHHGDRADGIAQCPRRGVERKCAPHAARVDRRVEQRVVGGVVDGIGEAGHRHQGEQSAVGRNEADERECGSL